MAITPSPLRYPGGKTAIAPMVATLIEANSLNGYHYVEPYAGGAGLALSLLFKNFVSHIHLNDLDLSIWAFWHSILFKTDDFIKLINATEITMDQWHKQKYIQTIKNDVDTLTLGFSTFFLNRTNRSGIIQKAGVIGGLEQKSKYSLDCRFNKKKLISKIEKIAQHKESIHLYNMDAIDFIYEIEENIENRLFCIDPPYFKKGQSLYTNFYTPDDHKWLSEVIKNTKGKWILTYDNAEEIKDLYSELPQYNFDLNYTAAEKRKGTELLITSSNFIIPNSLNLLKAI